MAPRRTRTWWAERLTGRRERGRGRGGGGGEGALGALGVLRALWRRGRGEGVAMVAAETGSFEEARGMWEGAGRGEGHDGRASGGKHETVVLLTSLDSFPTTALL